jgi:hypothetical protein
LKFVHVVRVEYAAGQVTFVFDEPIQVLSLGYDFAFMVSPDNDFWLQVDLLSAGEFSVTGAPKKCSHAGILE